jgi:hypothetical protein
MKHLLTTMFLVSLFLTCRGEIPTFQAWLMDSSATVSSDRSGNLLSIEKLPKGHNLPGVTNQPLDLGDVLLTVYSSSGEVLFRKAHNGGNSPDEIQSGLYRDLEGNFYFATCSGSFTTVPTVTAWKLDREGNRVWNRSISFQSAMTVTAVGSSRFVVGTNGAGFFFQKRYSLSTPFFTAGIRPDGTLAWQKEYGPTNFLLEDIVLKRPSVDNQGNAYLPIEMYTGSFRLGNDLLRTYYMPDSALIKFSPSGSVLMAKQFGGPGLDQVISTSVDHDGSVFITGSFTEHARFDNILLTGERPDRFCLYVAKMNPQGKFLWAQQTEGQFSSQGKGVVPDGKGGCYLAGEYVLPTLFNTLQLDDHSINSNRNIFVTHLTSDGLPLWSITGGAGKEPEVFLTGPLIPNGALFRIPGGVAVRASFTGGTFGGSNIPPGDYVLAINEPIGPALSIEALSDGNVRLAWSTNYSGWTLEQSNDPNLRSTSWNPVGQSVQVNGSTFRLTLPRPGSGHAFFRLRKE